MQKSLSLKMFDNPDRRVTHTIKECFGCGKSLENVPPASTERRQVYDIPQTKIEIDEHLSESKVCPCCGLHKRASFPEGVTHPVQYGTYLKGLLVYLNQYQLLPYERLVELLHDVFGYAVNEGTLFNTIRAAHAALEETETEIKNMLTAASIIHVDETGMRVEGKRQWMYVTSTPNLTSMPITTNGAAMQQMKSIFCYSLREQ